MDALRMLERLAEEQRQVNAGHGVADQNQIQRNLGQIANETNRAMQNIRGTGADPEITRDLAAHGHHFQAHQEAVVAVQNIQRTEGPEYEEFAETDLTGFLDFNYQMTVGEIIQGSRDNLVTQLQESFWIDQQAKWDDQRKKLIKEMTYGVMDVEAQNRDLRLFEAQNPQERRLRLLDGEAGAIAGVHSMKRARSSLDPKLDQYAKVVEFILNPQSVAVSQTTVPTLLKHAAAQQQGDLPNVAMQQVWAIVDTLLEAVTSASDERARSQSLLFGSLTYLGKQFLDVLKERNTQSALNPYEGYLRSNVSFGHDNDPKCHNGLPFWQQIYLFLRAWEVDRAINLATNQQHYEKLGQHISDWFMGMQHQPKPGYANLGEKTNPYKELVCNILFQNLEPYQEEIITTSEDYVWFRLAYMHGQEQVLMEEELNSLKHSIVYEWGAKSFLGYPLLYLQVLLLTHQFEKAVEYLRDPTEEEDKSPDGSEIEAVHLAIALCHLDPGSNGQQPRPLINLRPEGQEGDGFDLVVPAEANNLELVVPSQQTDVTLDLCSLLYQYARNYLSTKDPELAMKYLVLMPTSHKNTRITKMVELAKETRDYNRLFLADTGAPGSSDTTSLLVQLMDRFNCPDDAAKVTEKAAKDAEKLGFWEQSIDLYLASNKPEIAMDTLCTQVENHYSNWRTGNKNMILTERVKHMLSNHELCKLPNVVEHAKSLKKLKTVAEFFDAYNAGKKSIQEFSSLPDGQQDHYTEFSNPKQQKRTAIERDFHTALAVLQDKPQLLPIMDFNHSNSALNKVEVVQECTMEFKDERRPGVQHAVRAMVGPVCEILTWLYDDENRYGLHNVKEQNLEKFTENNDQIRMFAINIHNIAPLPTDVAQQVSQLRMRR